jgi:CheY-like chemotaxis protein
MAPKILLVEDDGPTRRSLASFLRGAGYDVAAVPDGQWALDFLSNHPAPSLILLDMLLPVLDGWHFLTEIKQMSKVRKTPILVITGTILTPEWAETHGCVGLLKKPIELDELLAEVSQCLALAP